VVREAGTAGVGNAPASLPALAGPSRRFEGYAGRQRISYLSLRPAETLSFSFCLWGCLVALEQENVAADELPASIDDLRNLGETARFFDVTVPTIREWIVRGCPVVEGGSNGVAYKLSLRAVHKWRQDEIEQADAARRQRLNDNRQLALEIFGPDMLTAPGEGGGAMTAKQLREHADAQRALVALELGRGNLVRVADLVPVLTAATRLFGDRIRALPDALARRYGLDPEAVAAMADDIDDALNDLADAVVAAVGEDEQ